MTPVVRVKLWTSTGRIVYSDEPQLVGAIYPLGADEQEALETGVSRADVSDLSAPENRFERSAGPLLEVYLPVHTPSGTPLLFETYSRYSSVKARTREVWLAFAPITFGSLLLLQIVQVPLAGASFVLAGAADRAGATGAAELSGPLDRAADGLRRSIRALRSLLVEIYPPNLRTAGLAAALSDLVAPLPSRGAEARLDLPAVVDLPEPVEALIFRVAQEAVRNVTTHAGARAVVVRLTVSATCAVLTVTDDGVGFDPAAVGARPASGHLGLTVLRDLAAHAGADLRLDSAPGQGTSVRLEVPLP